MSDTQTESGRQQKSEIITVRLPERQLERLDTYADESGAGRSEIIRAGINRIVTEGI